jgi:arylsulfatase A-like enzyme
VNRGEYYAIITHMDAQIGRILEALENSPRSDNTYVIFTADHGLACGNHGLMGKQNMYEHSMRVPWLIVGPGISRNKKVEVMAYLQDVMPTTLELAGAQIPDYVEFESLVPVLSGDKKEHYQEVFGGYMDFQRMIRTKDHKLILYPKGKTVLLFDLKEDPLELNNLAESGDQQVLVRDLFHQLLDQQRQLGDDLPLREIFPQLN